jgi:hypothetical protein
MQTRIANTTWAAFLFCVLAFFAGIVSAADLNQQQAATLKAAALLDPPAAAAIADGNDQDLADWLNAGQPTFWVYVPSLSTEAARLAITAGVSQLDNLTVGKRDSLLWLFSVATMPNASLSQAINDLCGTQNTLKNALINALRRTATRAEKILATGIGTSASPATLTFEGLFDRALASSVRGA